MLPAMNEAPLIRQILLVAAVVLLFACGGRSADLADDSGPGETHDGSADHNGGDVNPFDGCTVECPLGSTLSADCTCKGGGPVDGAADACADCPAPWVPGADCSCVCDLPCPIGSTPAPDCSSCVRRGTVPDGGPDGAVDASEDVTLLDGGCFNLCPPYTFQNPDCSCSVGPPPPPPYDSGVCECTPFGCFCGGFDASCAPCPSGTTLDTSSCQCIPLDASVDAAPKGDASTGPGCWLEGYDYCASDTWCTLGYCPDGTQTGCFCNATGTATCSVQCPAPPPCYIPTYGNCPAAATCIVAPCANPQDGSISCTCSQDGSYSCDGSCSGPVDGGIVDASTGTSTDAGPGCWFSVGYGGVPVGPPGILPFGGTQYCASNTYCQLGVCEDRVTPYGCFCNADGTSTCTLACPPPPPCYIPGYGNCAVNTSCDIGACPAGGGSISCFCSQGGYYDCSGGCDGTDGGF